MKKKREGTLKEYEYSSTAGDDIGRARTHALTVGSVLEVRA